jgi:nicotinamidase-related amidase
MPAQTLLQMSGLTQPPIDLAASTLVLIDYQNEYLDGPIALTGGREAVDCMALVLAQARQASARIIHIAHKGSPGGVFDRAAHRGAIIDAVAPVGEEITIEKPRPNAFSGTNLAEAIGQTDTPLLIAGFMTHMCVSSTARAALDLGYRSIVIGDACATRNLPVQTGEIAAADLHNAELAALADRFAWIVSAVQLTT